MRPYLGGILGSLVGTAGAIGLTLISGLPSLASFFTGVILGALGFWIGFATNRRL